MMESDIFLKFLIQLRLLMEKQCQALEMSGIGWESGVLVTKCQSTTLSQESFRMAFLKRNTFLPPAGFIIPVSYLMLFANMPALQALAFV